MSSADKKEYLDTFGVRITPPFLEFKRAFEGKTYKQTLSIQNISKSKVVVRITAPTSFAYKVKPVQNYNLSPGLCFVRKVEYVHSHVSAQSCIFAIYINENRYDYRLFATIGFCELQVTPQSIDFGIIDAGCASPVRTTVLSNDGLRAARFYIDSSTTDDYTLIIEPSRGLLQSKSSITVTLRLVANKEGPMRIDTWVKAETMCCLLLTATVIHPRLEIVSDGLASSFTLIDFPLTYVGLSSRQSIYIRNYSSSVSMFCSMGELDNKLASIEACHSAIVDYGNFNVNPPHGLFQPKQVKAIHFTFRPTKPKPEETEQQFYFCTVYVCRVKSKYLSLQDYSSLLRPTHLDSSGNSRSSWSTSGLFDLEVDIPLVIEHFTPAGETAIGKPFDEFECLKFYLHGIAEKPEVTVVPDELIVKDLLVDKRETRVLELRNQSHRLPIICVYKKIAFIDLDKTDIYIKAYSSVQVAVYITPHQLGSVSSHIEFDLVYYDYPKMDSDYKLLGKVSVPIRIEVKAVTKQELPQINRGTAAGYIKEVGKFSHNLKKKPKTAVVARHLVSKNSSALMALPNNTQKSPRPWRRTSKYKSIYTKTTRYSPPSDPDYELTRVGVQAKLDNDNCYMNYTRQEAARLRLSVTSKGGVGDYSLSNRRKLLATDLKLPVPQRLKAHQKPDTTEYLPLVLYPMQILNIVVDPLVIHTGPIAAHKKYDFMVTVTNNNTNTISAHIKLDKTNLIFPEGDRKLVKGKNKVAIPVTYIAPSVGHYTTEMKLVLNDCAFVLMYILASVHPINLQLSTDLIEFPEQNTRCYVDIINILNAEVSFSWKVTCNNFRIRPMEGVVKGNCVLTCSVEHLSYIDCSLIADVEFFCGGNSAQQLRLIAPFNTKKLSFVDERVSFKDLPLNIPTAKVVVLKNTSGIPMPFSLIEDRFTKYISVFPEEGVVFAYSYEVLKITLTLTACVTFNASIKFKVNSEHILELIVTGNVVYPDIIVNPSILRFKRIPCSTVDIIPFIVENKSNAIATVKFDMSMYTEFAVIESDNQWYTNVVEQIRLEKYEIVKLYLRFVPYAITSDKFILPMTINDILGAAATIHDINQASNFVMDVPKSKIVQVSLTFPVITVHSHAIEAKIILSKRFIKLSYVPPPNQCQPTYELRIFNAQPQADVICIRTDDLLKPLFLKYLRGKEVTTDHKVIICNLDAHEEVFFEVRFMPTSVGTYKAVLPIFLQSDNSSEAHNILCLQGTYPPAIITCDRPLLHFAPLPLRIHVMLSRMFILKNHLQDCTLEFRTQDGSDEQFTVLSREPIGKNTEELWLTIHSTPQKCVMTEFDILVVCSCNARCVVTAHKVVENSFLTSYTLVHTYLLHPEYDLQMKKVPSVVSLRKPSFISIADGVSQIREEFDLRDFFDSYPFFPDEDDDLYDYMQSCVAIMEAFLCRHVFVGKASYKIPRGIRYVNFTKMDKDKEFCVPPLIQILINLFGEHAQSYFQQDPVSDNEFEKAKYIYELYKKALTFLVDLGARFCCIRPEYLMTFPMYTFYINHPLREQDIDDEVLNIDDFGEFNRLTKQSWLDVILQTYKLVVYGRLIRPLEALPPAVDKEGTPHFEYRHSIKNLVTNNHLFSNSELLVLNWFEFHYNTVRTTYWADNDFLSQRDITYFGENMDDGFVFAAVTLAYCPYLEQHFKGLRKWPTTPEEILHNNVKVIQSWNILNFNLADVTVEDLANVNPMRTLVIAGYLFEVLPNMYPMETLKFRVGLSERSSKSFVLKNNNNFSVAYKVLLYGNVDTCFTVDKSLYIIQPRKSCKVNVTYWAKFVRYCECTLILSGEYKGYRYANSKVVTLMGIPNITYTTTTLEILTELYKYRETQLSITSPYTVKANYAIQFTCQQYTTAEEVRNIPYRLEYRAFTLSRCIPIETKLECNEDGVGVLKFCTFAIDTMPVPTWVFFTNREVGDFAVSITTIVSPSSLQQVLEVCLPEGFSELALDNYKKNEELFLEIPCQNRVMWNGIIEVLQKFAVADVEFWKEVVYTTTGMHVLQRLVHFTDISSKIPKICRPVDYNVAIHKKSNVILPKTVHINDQCLSAHVRLPVRFINPRCAGNFSLTLTSKDDLEIRQYHVVVKHAGSEDVDT